MKQFIIRYIMFILPVILGVAFMEYALRMIPNEYSVKIKNFEKRKDSIQVLILGSSHALRAVNPNDFKKKKAYNMAMVSQPLEIDSMILEKYINCMPRLETIIISVSYFSLSKKITEGEIANRLPYYHFFYDFSFKEYTFYTSGLKYLSLLTNSNWKESSGNIIQYYLGKRVANCDTLGWLGKVNSITSETRLKADARSAAKRHEDGLSDFNKNERLIQWLIRLCSKHNVKILFVNTPKTTYYNDLLNKGKEDKIDQTMFELTNNTSNALYLNFSHDKEFEKTNFWNSDHLSESGAKKLYLKLVAHI